jgi:hypothetical protein
MASPMRAAGLWNPKAIRVMTLILVFTDSIRPLLSPWSRVAWMLGRCWRIFFPSSVNSGMRVPVIRHPRHYGRGRRAPGQLPFPLPSFLLASGSPNPAPTPSSPVAATPCSCIPICTPAMSSPPNASHGPWAAHRAAGRLRSPVAPRGSSVRTGSAQFLRSHADAILACDPPQPAPASPGARRHCSAETATRTGRPRSLPRPRTSSRRLPDQRISPGCMT